MLHVDNFSVIHQPQLPKAPGDRTPSTMSPADKYLSDLILVTMSPHELLSTAYFNGEKFGFALDLM